MEHIQLIEEEQLGRLYGRDCIFLDSVVQTDSTLKFHGEINAMLASKIKSDIWIPLEMVLSM